MFIRFLGLKRSILTATLLIMALFLGGTNPTPAAATEPAEQSWYLVGNFAIPQLDEPALPGEPTSHLVDLDGLLSGTLGFRSGAFRAEGQFLYQEDGEVQGGSDAFGGGAGQERFPLNSVIDRDTRALAVMANGYYDYAVTPRWRLFAGAGLGLARLGSEAGPVDPALGTEQPGAGHGYDDTVLAYQGMLGLSYEVSAPLELFVGYRYFVAFDEDLQRLSFARSSGKR